MHTLDITSTDYDAITQGRKDFLVRKDNGFKTGDLVRLLRMIGPGKRDIDPRASSPVFRVKEIQRGGHSGLIPGYAVLGLERVEERVAA
jgi:Domain of unknown function (DUF3850)